LSLRQVSLTPHQLTLVDLLDKILDKGVVINGDITLSVGGIDLLALKINLVIASVETAKRYGIELPWEKWARERRSAARLSRRVGGATPRARK
jgi:Gas vesicle protein